MRNARFSALSLAAACLSAHAGTFQGYYTTTGGIVGLGWSSDYGPDYSASWGFVTNGPHAGSFNAFTERDFGGFNDIGYTSARCTGVIPGAGSASPARIHFVSDLVNHNFSGGSGVTAHSENNGTVLTSGPGCFWKMRWSLIYISDAIGQINVSLYEPTQGWQYPAGAFPGGTYLSGTRIGSDPTHNNAYFASTASLYQGQSFRANGRLIFTVDIEISDSPITNCPADFNNDGQVDDADFGLFVVGYNILDCRDPSMPSNCPADIDQNGFVDDTDFTLFVVAYNELICP